MTSPTTGSPIVLTADGRAWIEARRNRVSERLARVDEDLAADRTSELIDERTSLTEQLDELTDLLRRAVAPGEISDDPTVVELGDEVDIVFPDDERETFLVVHPVEAGMDEQRTSAESPLAKAVLGHRVGDEVTVSTPGGTYQATIVGRRRLA